MTEWTCVSAAAALRAGEVTPGDLVEHCLQRIERWEPRVRAWVLVDAEGARRDAQLLGEELRGGRDRGPLHGLPLGIKDIFDVSGWPTKAGSPLREGHRAERDATVVARLRDAGAILLGKTVTTEWASFDPPPTCNPWNLQRTPGGSSSGSAAAVALGMCLAAMGSQTGGSITRPASYCGVAGCKPSYGAVPLDGIVALAPSMDHPGPIARTAWDLELLRRLIADPMPDPSSQRPHRHACWPRLRLGVIESFFLEHADEAVRVATRGAIERLRAAGAEIELLEPPVNFAEMFQMHRRVMASECARLHRAAFGSNREKFGPRIAKLIEEGLGTPAADYEGALALRPQYVRQLLPPLKRVVAYLTPATVTPAPPCDTTGDPLFNSLWSYTGFPTVSLPCGLSPDGLPLSLQLVGSPGEDEWLLLAADWCQNRLNFQALPPLLAEAAP